MKTIKTLSSRIAALLLVVTVGITALPPAAVSMAAVPAAREARAGLVHLAFNVKDSKAAFDRAIAYGAKEKMEPKSMELPSEPPFPVVISFVYGPDGEELEFFQVR